MLVYTVHVAENVGGSFLRLATTSKTKAIKRAEELVKNTNEGLGYDDLVGYDQLYILEWNNEGKNRMFANWTKMMGSWVEI